MQILKSRWFDKFARSERISNRTLCEVAARIQAGGTDADYGGGLIKQRIARPGQGKSGGYRAIVVFRSGHRLFFVWGFAKNVKANLDPVELRDFKDLAHTLLSFTDLEIADLLRKGVYSDVGCHGQN
jgi:hypothetical protein